MNFAMERFFGGLDGAGLCDVSQSLGFVLCTVASSSSYRWCCKPKSISSERRLMSLGEPRFLYFFFIVGASCSASNTTNGTKLRVVAVYVIKMCLHRHKWVNWWTYLQMQKSTSIHLCTCTLCDTITLLPLGVCAHAHLCTCMCVSMCVCQAGLVSLKERLILPVSMCSLCLCQTESHNLKWTVSCMEIHWRGLL